MSEESQPGNAKGKAKVTERSNQPSPRSSAGWEGWLLAFSIVCIVAAPYATIVLPYRSALKTQAVLILGFTLVPLVAGLLKRGWWPRIEAAPRPVLIGIAAYASTTLLGAIVGLLRGNDLSFLAGQVLSMGLLPLAAIAGLALRRGHLWRAYLFGIVGSVAVASCVHLVYWIIATGTSSNYSRLFFSNKVVPASAALIAVNLGAVAALWERRWVRWASPPAIAATLLLILGSEIRSLWLVTAASLVGLILVSSTIRSLARHRVTRRAALGVLLAGIAFATIAYLFRQTRDTSPPGLVSHLFDEASLLITRARTLTQLTGGASQEQNNPLWYRGYETQFLLETFTVASPAAKAFGHGLGYTFTSKQLGYDEADNLVPGHPTNYIHNFYVFLLVKLGLTGATAALLALTYWVIWTIRSARACHSDPAKTFLVAAAAVWMAALVWGLACPEIIDFRVAPLWGFLLAASVSAVPENESGRTLVRPRTPKRGDSPKSRGQDTEASRSSADPADSRPVSSSD